MLNLGLTSQEKEAYERALVSDHTAYFSLQLLKTDHTPINTINLSKVLIDGQVTVNSKATITTRTLTLSLIDKDGLLGLDSGNPNDGFFYIDYMVEIAHNIYVEEIDKWVNCPVFVGPITKMERSGVEVSLEASGKEALAQDVWISYSVAKNSYKVNTIKYMFEKHGETRFKISTKPKNKLGSVLSLGPESKTWAEARKIASSINHIMYYDTNGYLVVKEPPSFTGAPVFSFRDGNGGSVLTDPKLVYDPTNICNAVRVIGKKPKSGPTPSYTAYPDKTHPLYPYNLKRNGKPRYLPYVIRNDSYKTYEECKAVAIRSLSSKIDSTMDITFDSFIIPHLEVHDVCSLTSENFRGATVPFRIHQFSIPLNLEGKMSVGYTRNMVISKRNIRNRVL